MLLICFPITSAATDVGGNASHIQASQHIKGEDCADNKPKVCQTFYYNRQRTIENSSHNITLFQTTVRQFRSSQRNPQTGDWWCLIDNDNLITSHCEYAVTDTRAVYTHPGESIPNFIGDPIAPSDPPVTNHPGKPASPGSTRPSESPSPGASQGFLAAGGIALQVLGAGLAFIIALIAIGPAAGVLGLGLLAAGSTGLFAASMYNVAAESANILNCSSETARRGSAPVIRDEILFAGELLTGQIRTGAPPTGQDIIDYGWGQAINRAGKKAVQLACDPPDADYRNLSDAVDLQDFEEIAELHENALEGVPDELRSILSATYGELLDIIESGHNTVVANEKYSGALEAGDEPWAELHEIIYELKSTELFSSIEGLAVNLEALADYIEEEDLDFDFDGNSLPAAKDYILENGVTDMQKSMLSLNGYSASQLLNHLENNSFDINDFVFPGGTASSYLRTVSGVIRGDLGSEAPSSFSRILYPGPSPAETTLCDVEAESMIRTLPPNAWTMLSLPCTPPEGATVGSIIGDDIPGQINSTWAIFTYDPSTNLYDPLNEGSSLTAGQGFWIIQKNVSEVELDMPVGSYRTASSFPASACGSKNGCENTQLSGVLSPSRWLLQGFPGEAPVDIDSLIVSTLTGPCSEVDGCSFSVASNAEEGNIIFEDFFRYSASENSYDLVGSSQSTQPWDAYWIAQRNGAEGVMAVLHAPRQTVP